MTGRRPASSPKFDIKGVNAKIASLLGTSADQIMINDVKVNPISKNVYLSVSRGRGTDAAAVIVRVDGCGTNDRAFARQREALVGEPGRRSQGNGASQRFFGGNPRTQTITDIAFVNGNVIVAGLSNEEWSSALRSIPYPFGAGGQGRDGADLARVARRF